MKGGQKPISQPSGKPLPPNAPPASNKSLAQSLSKCNIIYSNFYKCSPHHIPHYPSLPPPFPFFSFLLNFLAYGLNKL